MPKHDPRRCCRVAGVLFVMRRGATLHREYQHGNERWWLSDGTSIKAKVGREVAEHPDVRCGQDGLFGFDAPAFSQTFHHKQHGD
jgi:hypothetical protein